MNLFRSRKFRQGSLATAITAFGVALIILFCVVFSTLANRLDWSLDLTKDKLFEISEDTKVYLSELQRDVNIYVLNTEEGFLAMQPQAYMVQANEVIKKYDSLSARVNVQYIDIQRNPTFVSRFSNNTLRPNQILLECPENGRTSVLEYIDLFNITQNEYGQSSVRSSKAEQTMTSSILNVTSDKQIRAVMLGGHNEVGLVAFVDLLKKNNYDVTDMNLMTEEGIDPEISVAILAAPQRDLTEDELRKLDRFLQNNDAYGKTLMYLTSGDAPETALFPNLSAWLAEWGIGVGESVVFEMDTQRVLSMVDPMVALVGYAEDEYSADLQKKSIYPAVAYSRPLSVLFESRSAREVKTLLQFSPQSGIVPVDIAADWRPSEADMVGSIPALIVSTETRYDNLMPKQSNVLVSGAVYSLDAQLLGAVSYANSEYFLGLVDVLAGREESVRIQDKTISMNSIEVTAAQANTIGITLFILLPVALLIFGIVVWMRRRHR